MERKGLFKRFVLFDFRVVLGIIRMCINGERAGA